MSVQRYLFDRMQCSFETWKFIFPTKLWQSRLTCSQIPGASEVSNCHAVYTQTLIWPQRRQFFIVSSPSHQFFQVSLNPKFGHSRWKVFGKSSCTSRILIQGFSTTTCQKENCFVLKWEWNFFLQISYFHIEVELQLLGSCSLLLYVTVLLTKHFKAINYWLLNKRK